MQQQQSQHTYQAQASAVKYASVWQRFMALLIDGFILWLIASLVSWIFKVPFSFEIFSYNMISSPSSEISPIVLDLMLLPSIYMIVLEGSFGYTIGKYVTGLRVVNVETGAPIGWWQAIIRNLLRFVDSAGGYLLGAIFIWSSRHNQRLGDMVARTAVVYVRRGKINLPF